MVLEGTADTGEDPLKGTQGGLLGFSTGMKGEEEIITDLLGRQRREERRERDTNLD